MDGRRDTGTAGTAGSLPRRRHRRAARDAGPPCFAALDLGTHNCRMLAAVPARGGFRVVGSFSRIVRLGEDMAGDGCLTSDAADRTVAALAECVEAMARCGVTRARNVATAACRSAANCAGFVERVRAETGLTLEVISAEEEARLTLVGCAALLDAARPRALVFDIGGGSTEVAWVDTSGPRPRSLDVISMCHGVVTFAERFGGDRVDEAAHGTMVAETLDQLAAFDRRNRISEHVARGEVQMLGTSGTVTTLGALQLGLPRYLRRRVDGMVLDFAQVRALSKRLAEDDFAGRAALPCIGPERADLVVAGCAILEALCRAWPVGRLRVADRGLREGILHELIADHRGTPRP